MARARIITSVAMSVAVFAWTPMATAQLLDDHVWIGGTGNQLWQVDANWDLGMFPNDPGRVDMNETVISPVEGANLSVNLAANLNVDVGATDVTVAALKMGSTSGAVATNITSSGGRLVFENFERNDTTPEPDICAFNCGNALITSQGVAGATNTISAVVGVNDHIDVNGTKSLTLSGGLQEMAGSSTTGDVSFRAKAGMTVFVTGGITTLNIPVGTGMEDIPLALNSGPDAQGTIDVNSVISGAGRMRYGSAVSAAALPLGTVILRGNNTYSGRSIMSRGNVVLAHDNALGTGNVKQEGPSEGSLQTGYNFRSDNDSRTIANDMIIAQWQTVKGDHSLTWTGITYQDNARDWINMLPAGKTFTLSGGQFPNHTEENPPLPGRFLTLDGSGRTLVTGGLHDEWATETQTMNPGNFVGSFRFRGTGSVVVSGGNSTYTGDTNIEGGNIHFATSADMGNTLKIQSEAGAVGVDAGVAGILSKLNNSSNPALDGAANPVVFDRGGLMLGTSEYGMNLDFTGTHANAASMSLAAHETGSTYTGTITPANNTYRLGGGSGTLTLPNANQLTGARNVVATNGGTVSLTGSNNYTGTTSIIAKYVTSLQNAASADTINFVDGDIIPNDQMYVGTTLSVNTLANGGSSSSIGSASNAAGNLYIQGSTLKYVGAGANSDRLFTIGSGGATIDASGAGAINLTNTAALGVDIAEARTGNVNSFASGNTANDRSTVRNIPSTEDLQPGMPIMSPGLPLTGQSGGIPANTVITRILSPNDVMISNPVGDFAFYNNTPITFGAAPERKLTLTGSNTGANTLAPLIQNASDGGVVGLTKNGAGKWVVTGNNTYTGSTAVNAGTLLINGNHSGAGATTVASGGTLGGTGSVAGAVTVNSGGHLAPGAGIGTFTIGGPLTLEVGSILDFELGSPGTSDLLNVTLAGGLTINGGTLNLTNAGGLAAGTYTLIDYAGALNGSASNLTLGSTPGGFGFNLIDTGSVINLSVTSAGLSGDYNGDGKVDAADYVVWRKNPASHGGAPAGYNTWRANFGASSGSGSGLAGVSAVPEPTSMLLLMTSLALVGSLARRPGHRR